MPIMLHKVGQFLDVMVKSGGTGFEMVLEENVCHYDRTESAEWKEFGPGM
jgi:hypothetical protein